VVTTALVVVVLGNEVVVEVAATVVRVKVASDTAPGGSCSDGAPPGAMATSPTKSAPEIHPGETGRGGRADSGWEPSTFAADL
jgi:hypothetical protein